MESMEYIQLFIGPVGGALAGWIVAKMLKDMYLQKDGMHISALETHIISLQQDSAACNRRYEVLLNEVLDIRRNMSLEKVNA